MSIHVHSVYDTGTPDYRQGIEWNVQNESWTKRLEEYSPLGDRKVLNQGFNSNPVGKNYLELSFNLENANYPNIYDILFYATDMYVKDGRLCRMIDVANRMYVPPPEFSITTIPSSLVLRPGDEKNVELQIKSNTNDRSQVSLLSNSFFNDIGSRIMFNEISLAPFGIGTSILNVKAFEDARARPYTLPIVGNISIPSEVNGTIPTGIAGAVLRTNLAIDVLPPLTLNEQLSSLLNANAYLTSFIPLITTSIVVLTLSSKLDINRSASLLKFESKDIIQIDATVMIGVLILLTLSTTTHRSSFLVGIVTASIIFPFALSVLRVMISGIAKSGIKLMISGFLYLMAAVIFLALIQ